MAGELGYYDGAMCIIWVHFHVLTKKLSLQVKIMFG